MLNPFATNDAFNTVSLTKAINILPNNYGRIRELGIFKNKGVRSRTIMVEEQNGVLTLLQTMPVGAPGQQNKMGKRKVRSFTIPHIPLDDVILPDEYDGIRAFGQESATKTLAGVMNAHLQTGKNKFAITLEHLRAGALKGDILDADGTTLYNLFTEFGVSETSVNFALSTSTTNIRSKCMAVARAMEDALKGEVMTGIRALCSQGFFDALVSHPKVEEVYLNWQAAADRLGKDVRKGFEFGGILFEEYRGQAVNADGSTMKFIPDDTARFYPEGTMSAFETLFAPADFLETVNTLGQEIYAKQEPRKFNRGVDLHIQSNPLPICYRPGVLVKGTKTA